MFATRPPRRSTPIRTAMPPSTTTAATPRPATAKCRRPGPSNPARTRRSRVSMRGRILALLAFLVLALAACQGPAPPPPQRVEENAHVRATAALEAGRYPEAADLFRLALERAPESLPLHYCLAVSLC